MTTFRSNEEIGMLLKGLRIKSGLTQVTTAMAADIDTQTLKNIEAGTRGLTIREILFFADLFDIRTDHILRFASPDDEVLKVSSKNDAEVNQAIETFQECIDDYFGIKAITGN